MKKTIKTLLLSLTILVIIVVSVQFVSLTKANPKPYYPPEITIVSPSSNQIYNSSNVLLNVTVAISGVVFLPFDNITSLNYSLDGQADTPIPYSHGYQSYYGNTILSNLSDGPHSIFIHGENTPFYVAGRSSGSVPVYSEKTSFNATVSFTVQTLTTHLVDSFPTIPVLTTSIGIITLVSVSLLIYFKKHKFNKAL